MKTKQITLTRCSVPEAYWYARYRGHRFSVNEGPDHDEYTIVSGEHEGKRIMRCDCDEELGMASA